MSFFNKMRSFTEWHDTADQLDDAIKYHKKYQETFDSSLSNSYVEFVRKQPLEINDILFRINDKQKGLKTQHKEEWDAMCKLRAELEKLRPINEDIKKKRKDYERVKAQAEKSSKASEKADQKLNSLRATGTGTPEFKKAEDNAEICRRQKETDQANYEEKEKSIAVENKEYKKRLFQQLLSSIGTYAAARSSSAAPQVSVGEEMRGFGQQIPFYDDPSVEKLQTRLQTLRSEPLE